MCVFGVMLYEHILLKDTEAVELYRENPCGHKALVSQTSSFSFCQLSATTTLNLQGLSQPNTKPQGKGNR